MLEERIAAMIQADVDGELPASERAELEHALAQSGEARRFREEMVRIRQLLSTLPPVEPPAGLARRIVDRVELPAMPRWRSAPGAWFRPASYGLAFAAGVLIAVGIAQVIPGGTQDLSSLVGSMVSRDAELPPASEARLEIQAPGLAGEARLTTLNGVRALEFDLTSSRTFEVDVDFAGSGLRFGGLADPDSGVQVIDFAGGKVRVVNEGSHRFVLFMRPEAGKDAGGGTVGIAVRQDGKVLLRDVLQPGG